MAIRVVVVGLGARGRDWVHEIRNNREFDLAGGVDIDPGTQQLNRLTNKQFGQDFTEALARMQPKAVIVATPPDRHVEFCRQALERSVAVMVEKPFTTNLSEAAQLVSLATRQRTPLLVAQNYRYMRSFRTARRIVSEGTLGRVATVTCQYYRVPHQMAASLAGLVDSVMWGIAVHHLDMLRYVLGREVTAVIADSFSVPWGGLPQGASMRIMLTFDNDVRAVYTASYESSGHEYFEKGQEFYARFVGERATLHIFHRWLVLCEKGKFPRLVKRGLRKVTEEQVMLGQLEKALRTENEPESSGRDNLQTMAIVDSCLRSAREKRWINPQELLNELQ